MQIRAESGKSALPICNYSQILYQFLTFTQNLKRSQFPAHISFKKLSLFHGNVRGYHFVHLHQHPVPEVMQDIDIVKENHYG